MANNTAVDTVGDDSRLGVANMSSANKDGHRAVRAAKAGFFCSSFIKTCDTAELNAKRTCSCYKQLTQTPSEASLVKYREEQVPVHHARKTFSKYMDAEYTKMNAELKRGIIKSDSYFPW